MRFVTIIYRTCFGLLIYQVLLEVVLENQTHITRLIYVRRRERTINNNRSEGIHNDYANCRNHVTVYKINFNHSNNTISLLGYTLYHITKVF